MKDDRVYLRHIRDAIARIESYVTRGREAFLAETIIQDAVIRNLEVIGEAVRTSPTAFARGTRRSRGPASPGCATS
jgi:uncharacterized protein with HEPN domain